MSLQVIDFKSDHDRESALETLQEIVERVEEDPLVKTIVCISVRENEDGTQQPIVNYNPGDIAALGWLELAKTVLLTRMRGSSDG